RGTARLAGQRPGRDPGLLQRRQTAGVRGGAGHHEPVRGRGLDAVRARPAELHAGRAAGQQPQPDLRRLPGAGSDRVVGDADRSLQRRVQLRRAQATGHPPASDVDPAAGFARDEGAVAAFANLISFPMMFLSGVFFSLSNEPGWLQPITRLLPLTFLANALRSISLDGASLWAVRSDLLGLAVWLVVALVLAVRLFKWEIA